VIMETAAACGITNAKHARQNMYCQTMNCGDMFLCLRSIHAALDSATIITIIVWCLTFHTEFKDTNGIISLFIRREITDPTLRWCLLGFWKWRQSKHPFYIPQSTINFIATIFKLSTNVSIIFVPLNSYSSPSFPLDVTTWTCISEVLVYRQLECN
jgi:hypothetical protein